MGLPKAWRDPLYANGFALVGNAGLSAAFGFAFWLLAARKFHADALGIGAAVVSAATLAALVGKAGFDAAIVRYTPSADAKRLRRLLGSAAAATLGLTAVVALGVLAVAAFGLDALGPLREPAYAAGFLALALATSGAWILDAYFVAEQRAWLVLARNLAFNVVKLAVPVALAFEWGGRAVPLAWGLGLLASLAVALVLLPGVVRRHVRVGQPPARGAAAYSMQNYALNLSEFLPGLLLPVLVLHVLGPEENARFFLAWTVAAVALLASKAIAQSAFAALVRDGDARASVRKGALLSAALLGPAALVLHFGARPLLEIFGPHYAAGAGLLQLLALSLPFVAATNLYLAFRKAREGGWELTVLPLAMLVALLVAMPIALARGGIEGVGLVWLFVQVAAGVYAATRLHADLPRESHGRTLLRRHPHQG